MGKAFELRVGTFFIVILAFVFTAGAISIGLVAHNSIKNQALEEAKAKALILLNRNLATHSYFSKTMKPRIFEWGKPILSRDYFEPSWMSSTYAVREIDKEFKALAGTDYYYKECAINARSPFNEADELEKSFLREINDDHTIVERSGIRILDGKPYLTVMRSGEVMEESCLRCHSTPEHAPSRLVELYGTERSFNRRNGEIVSAFSIRIPLSSAYAPAKRFTLYLLLTVCAILSILFLGLFWSYRRFVQAPLDLIREKALEISRGTEVLGTQIPLPRFKEFQELATSFNRMSLHLRQAVEKALEESEERYRILFESANDAICIIEDGKFVDCSRMALNLFGCFGRNGLIGKEPHELSPVRQPDGSESKEKALEKIALALNGEPQFFEWKHKRCDGTLFDVEVSLNRFEVSGKPMLMTIIRDATERKVAQASLKQAKEYLENILENSPDPIGIVDEHGKFKKLNRVAVQLFGYSLEDMREKTAFDLYADIDECGRLLSSLRRNGVIRAYQVSMRRKDGTTFPVELSISLLKNSEGRNLGSIAIARDLSEIQKTNEMLRVEIQQRHKAEKALRESENMYRAIFENTGAATVIVEEDKTISLANAECEKLSEYSRKEIEGKVKWDQFISESAIPRMEEYHRLRRIDPEAAPKRYEFKIIDREGTPKVVLATIGMIPGTRKSVASFIDITEKKKLEEQLFRADKLDSVGVLAGGIAHDFNNILGVIMGNASLARMHVPAGERVHSLLQEVERAAVRAKELTLQLLTFSKGGAPIKKAISILDVIKESANFALRGSNVLCEISTEENLRLVDADAGQISQVINNMIINAKQAMPMGGVVQLSVGNCFVGKTSGLPLKPGNYVRISIQDCGTGIPKEHLQKIFDPYFTTKQSGSGLGLATSYSIINKHGGYIGVRSELGVGTTFHIYLPASENEMEVAGEVRPESINGRGRILVMDDEEMLRGMVSQMLSHLGYESVSVKNGSEAVQVYGELLESGEHFDAVLLDLTIPGGMGGAEVVRKLKEMNPAIKAIASSGYSNDPVMARFAEYGFTGTMAKPYTLEELARVLRDVLNEGQRSRPARG